MMARASMESFAVRWAGDAARRVASPTERAERLDGFLRLGSRGSGLWNKAWVARLPGSWLAPGVRVRVPGRAGRGPLERMRIAAARHARPNLVSNRTKKQRGHESVKIGVSPFRDLVEKRFLRELGKSGFAGKGAKVPFSDLVDY